LGLPDQLLSNVSACPGGPSYASGDGEYVPGNPKDSLSRHPLGEVGSKPRSDDSLGGTTPEYESYWRVEEREAKKQAKALANCEGDNDQKKLKEVPSNVTPGEGSTGKGKEHEVKEPEGCAADPVPKVKGEVKGTCRQPEQGEKGHAPGGDGVDRERGEGHAPPSDANESDSDDSIPLGYSPSSRAPTQKKPSKFDKYYYKPLDCF